MKKRSIIFAVLVLIFLVRYATADEPAAKQNFSLFKGERKLIEERIRAIFPEPYSGIASGLLIGSREMIPRSILEDFQRTGLTHILALSGYNIILVISFIGIFVRVLPRKFAAAATIIMILFFVLLTGASASTVRASIMGSLGLIGAVSGRKSGSLRALFVTGYAMALINPFLPFHNLSFQLSFAATAGILLFAEPLKNRLAYLGTSFSELIGMTLAAQFGTLPIILFAFHGFSLISLVANAVILPLIPPIMFFSFLGFLFGKIAASPAFVLIELMLNLNHFFASAPFAFIDFGIS